MPKPYRAPLALVVVAMAVGVTLAVFADGEGAQPGTWLGFISALAAIAATAIAAEVRRRGARKDAAQKAGLEQATRRQAAEGLSQVGDILKKELSDEKARSYKLEVEIRELRDEVRELGRYKSRYRRIQSAHEALGEEPSWMPSDPEPTSDQELDPAEAEELRGELNRKLGKGNG